MVMGRRRRNRIEVFREKAGFARVMEQVSFLHSRHRVTTLEGAVMLLRRLYGYWSAIKPAREIFTQVFHNGDVRRFMEVLEILSDQEGTP